ncbi:site-specific integrase [bacterium]|nr:site-specific integrase [bacterium]
MNIVEPIRNKDKLKEIEKILEKQSQRNLLLFDMGINFGLRISDILALDVIDVKERDFILLNEKKTGKFKKIHINFKIKSLLKKYTENKSPHEPLFKTKFKNRMDRITAYRIINKACKLANINTNIGTHTLRKTFGYHFYKEYKDVAILQKILNHSSPTITMRYIGIEQEEIDELYNKFVL